MAGTDALGIVESCMVKIITGAVTGGGNSNKGIVAAYMSRPVENHPSGS